MDIKREPPKKTKQYIYWSIGVLAVVVITGFVSRLKPAAPTVERGTLWIDVVKRGEMTRAVNAPGTLIPEHVRIIVATTSGRVETLPVRPGVNVTPSTLLLDMSNPDVQLQLLQDQQQLNQAYSNLATLKTSLRQQLLSEEGAMASLRTQYLTAQRNAAVLDSLDKRKLATANEVAGAHDTENELKTRLDVEQKRYDDMKASMAQQVQLGEQQIESVKRILDDQKSRVASMHVYPPESGQLQTLGNPQLELGQWVNAGMELARVVQPGRLKAVLRVPETQAKDVAVGQRATIDLHNNTTVEGHVTRTDPSSQAGTVTVEVALDGAVPAGTRSDLAVDGTIEIERLHNVLFVGRPGFGQPESSVGIFRLLPGKGEAALTTVKLGVASVNTIEIKGGLAVGDSVIISDMSQYDNVQRVRIK